MLVSSTNYSIQYSTRLQCTMCYCSNLWKIRTTTGSWSASATLIFFSISLFCCRLQNLVPFPQLSSQSPPRPRVTVVLVREREFVYFRKFILKCNIMFRKNLKQIRTFVLEYPNYNKYTRNKFSFQLYSTSCPNQVFWIPVNLHKCTSSRMRD